MHSTTPDTLVRPSNAGNLVTDTVVIAEGTDNKHHNVIRLVRKYMEDFEAFGRVDIKSQPFETAGGPQNREVAILNREQAMFAMTLFRNNEIVVEFKKNLIRAFTEMEKALTQPALPDRRALAQMVIEAEDRATALEEKIEQDAPKVDYHDTYVADEDLIQFRTLANQLNIGEQGLKSLLVSHKWIYNDRTQRWSNKEGSLVWENRWRANASKKRYFRLVPHHKVPRINGEVRQTLKVTPQGAVAISRALDRWRDADPTAPVDQSEIEFTEDQRALKMVK